MAAVVTIVLFGISIFSTFIRLISLSLSNVYIYIYTYVHTNMCVLNCIYIYIYMSLPSKYDRV